MLITGTFTRSHHGHLGAFWGALEQVKEIRELQRSK